MQVQPHLAQGEGIAHIFKLAKGAETLTVQLDAPQRASQISVYSPNLNKAAPILQDSAETKVSPQRFQTGYYEVVIVSIAEQPFDFTLTLKVEPVNL